MSKNKITRWIDAQNETICLTLTSKYYQNREQGKPSLSILAPKFWPLLLLRSFILLLQLLRFNSALLKPWQLALKKQNGKTKELLKTATGLNHFILPEYRPDFYEPVHNLHFHTAESPLLSIFILLNADLNTTLYSLSALNYHLPKEIALETIIVYNQQTAKIKDALSHISGLTYVHSDTYHHSAIDTAAKMAKAPYFALLSSSILIQKNWLQNLLETLQTNPQADCAGSKIISAYGLLLQAGGLLSNKKTKISRGKYQHPNKHTYNYNRPVDFCSEYSLLVRKKEQPYTTPLHTIYVATAMAVNFNSNKHFIASTNKDHYNDRALLPSKTILVIDADLPMFDKDSGSNRLLHLLKMFRALDYHIIFLPEYGSTTEPYFSMLRNMGIEVIQKYSGLKLRAREIESILPIVNIAWLSRPAINKKYNYIFNINNNIRWVYDTVDLHYVRFQREAELITTDNTYKKELLQRAASYKELEIGLSKKADAVIAITPIEAEALKASNANTVKIVPNIHVIQPSTNSDFQGRNGIMFIGSFYHAPNIDAVTWLIKEIMPGVWKHIPDVKVYIIGNHATQPVLELASQNVIVTGYVKDVAPYFNSSRIFVAPLRYGAGMKGKIGQALEYALPTVSTAIGTEGMNLQNNINILEADTALDFQQAILKLYSDKQLWQQIQDNAVKALQPLLFDYQQQNVSTILSDLLNHKVIP